MQCLYEARNMTKCPLMRCVCIREVSISRGFQHMQINAYFLSKV